MYPTSLLEDQKADFRRSMQESIESILSEAGVSHVKARVYDDGDLKVEIVGCPSDLLLVRPLLYKYAGIVCYRSVG